MGIIENLKKYFKDTSADQVKKDWDKASKYDTVNSPDALEYIDILKKQPTQDYCKCEIVTNRGRILEVEYYDEYGTFCDDDNEYGWVDNGDNPELVIKWRILKNKL